VCVFGILHARINSSERMLQSSWVRKKVRHYLSVLILTFAGQSYFNLILIFKYQTLSLHWSNVNQRFSINQRFFDGNFISDGLNTDHRSLSYSRGHVIGTFQRCDSHEKVFDFRRRGNWSNPAGPSELSAQDIGSFSQAWPRQEVTADANKTMLPIISGISCWSANGKPFSKDSSF